jgi:hypothetical protein
VISSSAQRVEKKTVKNYTEIATNDEIKQIVKELFQLDENNLLSYAHIDYQGYHNTSNIAEDRAPNR